MNLLIALYIGVCVFISMVIIILATTKTLHAEYSGSFVKVFVQMLIFYGVFLMPLLCVAVGYQWFAGTVSAFFAVCVLAFCLLYIYARLIEPKHLKVIHRKIQLSQQADSTPIKIALLADLHLGLFDMYPRQLQKIVATLNAMNDIDAVVFAGDWTYEPEPNMLEQLAPLARIKQPCYHVLGNHDEQCPGPDISQKLLAALTAHHVQNIEAMCVDLGSINLLGVGDLWASKVEFAHFQPENINNKPCVILAHNPDTANHIPEGLFHSKPLMLSGHTHGGQVFVPYLTPYIFRKHSATGYYEGLYQHEKAQVFVTAGTGMVFLPFRLGMPPRIDVLTIC